MITHLHNPVINNCRKTCVKSSRRGPFIAECAWMYSLLIVNYLYLHAEFAYNPVVLCATWGVVHCDPAWTRHTSSLLPRTRLMWCVTTANPNGRDTHWLCLCLLYFCGASYEAIAGRLANCDTSSEMAVGKREQGNNIRRDQWIRR